MPIFKGSRYDGSKYTEIKFSDGSRKKFIHPRKPVSRDELVGDVKIRRVRNTDTLDYLAKQYGKDERKWWLIADVNNILFPLDIDKDELIIPNKKEFKRHA